jgi:hypothetical protein
MNVLLSLAVWFAVPAADAQHQPARERPPQSTQPATAPATQPSERNRAAASQPASQPANTSTTFRKPPQAEVLADLLRRTEQRVIPQTRFGDKPTADGATAQPTQQAGNLLAEGETLIERPGRLIRTGERSEFAFNPGALLAGPESMEVVPNRWLELMEEEAKSGQNEFIISGEVTRYRGKNYLRILKVTQRVPHGNIAP